MEAPLVSENQNLNLKIEIDKDKIYDLIINNSSNSLSINISKENSFPKLEYSKDFSLNDLAQNSKFFKVFDDIKSVIEALKETFETKKPKLQEENEYIKLIIIPTLLVLGESILIIPKKKSDDKSIINELCNVVNKQGKEIETLKNKINILEEKVKKLEENKNQNVRKIRKSNTLIGDIIKTEEQYNLICDWINRDKNFIFKLLYKATMDGDTKNIFHNKCDNQGSTVSIISSKDGQIFGGYASKSWNRNQNFIPDPNSFLFNVNIKRKFPGTNNPGLRSGYICNFGDNCWEELYLYEGFLSKGPTDGSYNGGTGYNLQNYDISGGKDRYSVKELEVYKIEEY